MAGGQVDLSGLVKYPTEVYSANGAAASVPMGFILVESGQYKEKEACRAPGEESKR